MAVSFLLAQEYGFKRVMSSYVFEDADAGPPDTFPVTDGECSEGWVCEHRWRTTSNMVQVISSFTTPFKETSTIKWVLFSVYKQVLATRSHELAGQEQLVGI